MNDGSTGARLRDEGIERAIAHADHVEPSWSDKARAALLVFLNERERQEFTSDDVISFAYEKTGLTAPPDGRAWGAVLMLARRAGLIVKVGYGVGRNPKHHNDISAIWRRAA